MSLPLPMIPQDLDGNALIAAVNDRLRRISVGVGGEGPAGPAGAPGASATTDISWTYVGTSPYDVKATDEGLTFVGGAGTVNLPASASLTGRHAIYLLNNSGGTLTLNPAAGDTIWGQTFYALTPGSAYTIFPNV
jgi:hypothetical protein